MPILNIRDENGNFTPIRAIRGADGKSAYQQAQEGGYNGTEEEFVAFLNGLLNSEITDILNEKVDKVDGYGLAKWTEVEVGNKWWYAIDIVGGESLRIPYYTSDLTNDSDFARIETGSYSGTGVFGINNKTIINLNNSPKILLIYEKDFGRYLLVAGSMCRAYATPGGDTVFINWNLSRTKVSLWVSGDASADTQFNNSSYTYGYIAIY